MQIRSLRNLYLLLTWFGLLFAAASIQPFLPQPARIFPTFADLIPGFTALTEKSATHSALSDKEDRGPDHRMSQEDTAHATVSPSERVMIDGRDHAHLAKFYIALRELKEKKRSHVRVIHYGDSINWADNVAYRIKNNLQKEFGDGGRGLVPIIDSRESVLKGHKNLTPGGFELFQVEHSSYQRTLVPELGFTAKSVRPQKSGAVTIQEAPAEAEPWTKAGVLLRAGDDATAGSLLFETGGAQAVSEFSLQSHQCQGYEAVLPATRHLQMSVNYKDRPPFIDGLLLETAYGLSYSTVVRMGIHQAWMAPVSDAAMECGYRWFAPDLIVFQFGVNESASIETRFDGYTPEKYENQLREYYQRLRRLLPDTSILMIGPLDRVRSQDGILQPVPAQDEVRRIQRKLADEFNIAFFDTYAYMGGRGHIIQMVRKGLALNDYMHLSQEGGNLIADGISSELLRGYTDYTGSQPPDTESQSMAELLESEDTGAISFNSRAYVVFLTIVLIVSSILVRWPDLRLGFLVLASYYFYASWKLWPVLLIVASTLLDYFCALGIEKARAHSTETEPDRGTRYLIASLVGNLGLLFTFKYLNFTGGLINSLIQATTGSRPIPVFDLLLPVGISFYTFQTLSYTIDVWRGVLAVERNFLRFSLYVTFFPQLVAGPIVRASEFLPEMKRKVRHFVVTHQRFSAGIFLILCGLIKKMTADWIGITIVDRVYASPSMFTSAENLAAVYAYGLQIYGDFSGYTDIAIGSANLLGFHLTVNFRRPYQAASVTEYWRRWHISLGSWIRDYIYISLGGNRTGVARNLLITMFLAGLWHGAGLNYVVWGTLHGLVLVLERWIGWGRNDPKTVPGRILRVLVTLHFILFAFIIFRFNDPVMMKAVVDRIFSDSWVLKNLDWRGIAVVVSGYIYHLTPIRWKEDAAKAFCNLAWPLQSLIGAAVTVLAFQLALPDIQPFIYFQF